jgi:hypothetical protein
LLTKQIGEFICYLSLSDLGWSDLALAIIMECLDRDVKWILPQAPELNTTRVAQCYRLRKTFTFSRVGKRLLMFQMFFLTSMRVPTARRGDHWLATLDAYDRSLGRPPNGMVQKLQQAVADIHKVDTWDAFFDYLKIPRWSTKKMVDSLTQAIVNSRAKVLLPFSHLITDAFINWVWFC